MPIRRALVTGGSRGLGAAISRRLLEQGLDVVVTARSPESAATTDLDCHVVDFTDQAATVEFARAVEDMGIDVLVNNAGINRVTPFADIDPTTLETVLAVNLVAPTVLCRSVLTHMRGRNWGRIVNIASIFAEVSKAQRAAYSSSKFGLVGMTKALAAEVAAYGILANCVAPGVIDTDMTRTMLGERGIAEMCRQIPIGRLGRPEEVAALVCFLVSDDNSYISGQSILIDGGFVSV